MIGDGLFLRYSLSFMSYKGVNVLQVNEKPYRPDVGVFLNPAHYLGYSLGLGYCT